ncbi:MAG TPA: GNAT family N-acetyltransferase [Planctomycetaceae bacterium]|nr:GNAT family N-acetyltransferase [Planctomycetaceae bacterium]
MSRDFAYVPLADPADEDTLRDLLSQSLNVPRERWPSLVSAIGRENLRVLRRGERIIGGLGIFRMSQWFGGRPVPCGGISVVGIAPEERGQGAAVFLMRAALDELSKNGTALSTLFASTQRLYRRVGYEQAGNRYFHELPLSSIGELPRELPVVAVPVEDSRPFEEPARQRARLTNGNLERTAGLWRRVLSFPDQTVHGYVIGDAAAPEGYVIYSPKSDQPGPFNVCIRDMAALTPAAARSLWAFIRDHRSVAESVIWFGPANEPLLNLTEECRVQRSRYDHRWLLRIVDVRRALESRGYPEGTAGELHFDVRDNLLAANSGRFVLTVADGRGEVRPGGRGELRTDIRGLAPLYSGLFTPAVLRTTGQLEADDRPLATAAGLFAGPEPWMAEMF